LFPLAVNMLAKVTTPLLLEQPRAQPGTDKHAFRAGTGGLHSAEN